MGGDNTQPNGPPPESVKAIPVSNDEVNPQDKYVSAIGDLAAGLKRLGQRNQTLQANKINNGMGGY